MKAIISLLPVMILVAILIFVLRQPATTPQPSADPASPAAPVRLAKDHYHTAAASRDGIGKFYHGREIAKVMGHLAIDWLERQERESEEAPSLAMRMLDLGETDVLADIGAGSGYYSLRLAMQHPKGRIIAVDIQPEMIDFLENRKSQLGIGNIETHLGTIEDTGLPLESIDAALLVDAYHEFSHPYEMMLSLYRALKPGGRIFLLEYRAEDPDVSIKPLHKMTEEQARKELEYVGFEWIKTHRSLPWQHLLVFRKP